MAGILRQLLTKTGVKPGEQLREEGDPFNRDWGSGSQEDSVVYQVSSVLMRYPSQEQLDLLPELLELAGSISRPDFFAAVQTVAQWYRSAPLAEVAGQYVQEYDLSRRHAFHLSYWTEGDTRRRGQALTRFKQMYRESGMLTDLQGELPDYLPLVLEFTALVDRKAGRAALQAYRPSLEMLRLALKEDKLAFYGLVQAICDTLPGPSPQTAQEIQELAGFGPPSEQVGLSSSDPRLLPLLQPSDMNRSKP
ncbi:MAG: nitrate reductase molybdenum cofactor assembly chaperone [Rothia sp. (in: high G+C Gram-positive bacteria)]|nr:nitrate reductase molybdenum cofactor assembly chaperone [Rothia sp. (in: high G+C Gram-positive bacteria)]